MELSDARQRFAVFEAGGEVGASVREWGHVRLFTPWRMNVSRPAGDLLTAAGWMSPARDGFPTGNELVDRYLHPLGRHDALRPHIHLQHRVVAVGRAGLDKLKSAGRDQAPLELVVETPAGRQRHLARAVIDASGTWTDPNPLGSGGRAAEGEEDLSHYISYIPDVLGAERARFAGRATLVVGSGHSALNTLLDLLALAGEAAGTRVHWGIRRASWPDVFATSPANDELPERSRLERRVASAVASRAVAVDGRLHITALAERDGGVVAIGDDGRVRGPFDTVVAACGFRPNLAMTRELRLDLDPAVEAPRSLATLIDPDVHSCRTVPLHGADELTHPQEPNFYIAGMKSYGRAPTFLMRTGYAQVRSLAAALSGDWVLARDHRAEASAVCGPAAACAPALPGASCDGQVACAPAEVQASVAGGRLGDRDAAAARRVRV